MIPLHKSRSRNNFRPISILPAFSKVFEKAISTKKIIVENNSLITKSQYSFRAKHNTETANLHFMSNVYQYLEKLCWRNIFGSFKGFRFLRPIYTSRQAKKYGNKGNSSSVIQELYQQSVTESSLQLYLFFI